MHARQRGGSAPSSKTLLIAILWGMLAGFACSASRPGAVPDRHVQGRSRGGPGRLPRALRRKPLVVYLGRKTIRVAHSDMVPIGEINRLDWVMRRLLYALFDYRLEKDLPRAKRPHPRSMIICARSQVAFRVLKRVLYTSALAGYDTISYALLTTPGVAVKDARRRHCRVLEMPRQPLKRGTRPLDAVIGKRGYVLVHGAKRLVIPSSNGDPLNVLRAELRRRRGVGLLRVVGQDTVRFGRLLSVLERAVGVGYRRVVVSNEVSDGRGYRPTPTPFVFPGIPAVAGKLDATRAARVVYDHVPALLGCYFAALRTRRGIEGNLTATITLDGLGYVKATRITTDFARHEGLERCFARVLRLRPFSTPASSKGAVVRQPFRLILRPP